MALDVRLQHDLQAKKTAREADRASVAGAGGGEPPKDGTIEQRLGALERNFYSVDKALSVIAEQLKHVASREDMAALRTDVATMSEKLDTKASAIDVAIMSGKLDTKASATELAELKGRVTRIPTVPVLVSILVLISLLFAAGSWAVRHLPESWSRALQ